VTSFDTNVAVRLLVDDDPAQCARAERAFRRAIDQGGRVLFGNGSCFEVAWALRVAYKLERAAIASALRKLVTATGVTVEHEAIVSRALEAFETGTADFSDYFILESSRDAGASPVLTFDKTFARVSGAELVPEA
jgi:predicted nucleic-acid-binding protein